MQLLWTLSQSAARALDGLYSVYGLFQDLRVVDVGRRVDHRKWDAFSVDHNMALRALFAFICRILAGLLAPPGAGTLDESKDARSQSMWSASPRRSKILRCSSSHTPASCHSLSLRKQVIPEPQPISWGSISQGMPLLRTNNMAVRVARLSMRGLPPLGLGGSSGSSGSITSHSSSVRSSLAILSAYPLSSFVRRTKCIGARQASDRFVLRLSLPSSHCPSRKREARASTNPTIGNWAMSSSLFIRFDLGSDPSQILLIKTAKFVAVPAALISSLMRKCFQPRIQILEQRAYQNHLLHGFAGHTNSGEAAHPKLKQVIMRQLVARVHGNLYLIQQIVRDAALLFKFLPELSCRHLEDRLHLLPCLLEWHLLWRFGLVNLDDTHQGKLEELDTEHGPAVLGEYLQLLLCDVLFAHLIECRGFGTLVPLAPRTP